MTDFDLTKPFTSMQTEIDHLKEALEYCMRNKTLAIERIGNLEAVRDKYRAALERIETEDNGWAGCEAAKVLAVEVKE